MSKAKSVEYGSPPSDPVPLSASFWWNTLQLRSLIKDISKFYGINECFKLKDALDEKPDLGFVCK